MYAIIKTGGKQVKVEVGQAIYVEKLNVEAGEKVVLDEVILVGGESTKLVRQLLQAQLLKELLKTRQTKESRDFPIQTQNTLTVNKVTVNRIQKL